MVIFQFAKCNSSPEASLPAYQFRCLPWPAGMEAIYLGELDIDEERSERAERGDTVLGPIGRLMKKEGFETSPLNNS